MRKKTHWLVIWLVVCLTPGTASAKLCGYDYPLLEYAAMWIAAGYPRECVASAELLRVWEPSWGLRLGAWELSPEEKLMCAVKRNLPETWLKLVSIALTKMEFINCMLEATEGSQ